jgi:hypothetical protein
MTNLIVYANDLLAGSRLAIDMLKRIRDKVDDKLLAASPNCSKRPELPA